jgi:hypothetical protein
MRSYKLAMPLLFAGFAACVSQFSPARIPLALKCALAKFSCAILVLLAVTASPTWGADAAPRNIGFVLDVSGQCFQNASTYPLQVGQRLPAGATLHFPAQYKSTDYVEIALRDGTKLSVHCSEPRRCESPIHIPGATEGNSVMQTILDSLLPQDRQYVVPITRGLRPPRELVLEFVDGEVDLGPLFEDVDEGVYELVLDPISISAETTASTPITLSVSWIPDHPSQVAAASLRPGLFEASVQSLQLDEVWVLVAPATDYRRDASDLEDAAQLAGGWQLSPANLHGFLRTYLASLASKANSADR